MSFFSGKFNIQVATASGTEASLKRELISLGYTPSPAEYGRISFEGDMRDVARACVFLRTASRVRIVLARFPASTFDELYDGTRMTRWGEILPSSARLNITARSIRSTLFSLSDIQRITKKSISDYLTNFYSLNRLPEDGTPYSIEAGIADNICTIVLDATGEALHKRGYRVLVGEAPLRETLAAAIINMSVWRPDRVFADPFCGSGTLPIEAALIACNIAPGISRSFAFESFEFAPNVLSSVKKEARDLENRNPNVEILANDISPDAIKMSKKHAANAGVDKLIKFSVCDIKDFTSQSVHGVLFANPPYGERLLKQKEVQELTYKFGKTFASLNEWSAYVITAFDAFEKFFGKRADKRRKLYNSEIECILYRFLGAPPRKGEQYESCNTTHI